jgi:membrane associated rhomboid family serine protease
MLLVANIAIFVLTSMTSQPGRMPPTPLFDWLAMFTPGVLRGQVWRLITSDYLHWNLGHIFMNMLGLYFLGRPLERDWGGRKFFAVYTIAGVLGSLFYMLLTLVGWLSPAGIAAGASGCVLALLGACAVRYPHAELLVYFLFPIKIRTAALLFGAWYALNLFHQGPNAGGDACHLAGMVFGAWWAWAGDRWWTYRGTARWRQLIGQRKQRSAKPRPSRSGSFAQKMEERRADAETIDAILRKVYDGGIHSLTEDEKRALQEATERQRQRDREAGRVDRL